MRYIYVTNETRDIMQDDSGNTIFGTDLTWDQYDRLMYERVTAKWVEFERELFRAKWFDYRFMHPVAATYVAAYHFDRVYRQIYARNVNRETAEHIRVQKQPDLFECSKMFSTAIWRTANGRRDWHPLRFRL